MILLEQGEILLRGQPEEITKWEVWFQTPNGLVDSYEKLKDQMKSEQWPGTLIRPVPVAIGQRHYEVGV